MTRLKLEPGLWYGWTMWPGYLDEPYHSPVLVRDVTRRGNRIFDLEFINAGYAQGVQELTYTLETLRREDDYILAGVVDTNRSVAIEPLTPRWITHHMPHSVEEIRRIADKDKMTAADIAKWLLQYSPSVL